MRKHRPQKSSSGPLLQIISERYGYANVRDEHIPMESKQNIVLTPAGMTVIADRYRKKYGIEILIYPYYLTTDRLADEINSLLHEINIHYPHQHQIGCIFISADDPDDQFGHALPMIIERENKTTTHLFFLDTNQFFSQEKTNETIHQFRQTVQNKNPQLKLWSILGPRQIDYSSCYTDAMVMLKDGLRIPSFKKLVENRVSSIVENIAVFYAPSILTRTAQIGSFFKKSKVDLMEIVHQFHHKNKSSVTANEFIKQNHVDTLNSDGQLKKVGLFTLKKGSKYARILDETIAVTI